MAIHRQIQGSGKDFIPSHEVQKLVELPFQLESRLWLGGPNIISLETKKTTTELLAFRRAVN